MDDNEKFSRCINAPMIHGKDALYCVVYGRTVGSCEDCAFSTSARPLQLQGRAMTR
jgi:hypothetical protein